jgi:hypothetical protein
MPDPATSSIEDSKGRCAGSFYVWSLFSSTADLVIPASKGDKQASSSESIGLDLSF